jgi:hypothetical protein
MTSQPDRTGRSDALFGAENDPACPAIPSTPASIAQGDERRPPRPLVLPRSDPARRAHHLDLDEPSPAEHQVSGFPVRFAAV